MWAQFFAVVCSPRPKRGRQNAPGAAIALRARGCLGLALLCVLGRFKPNWPLSHARQAQAAISLIAKNQHSSTKTAGNSTALATSTGQRTRLDRAHGGTHPAKGWPPERARRGHRSPGKGLPWVGAALRAAAFEGESTSWPRQASASSYFIDSKKHQNSSTPGKRTRLDQAHGGTHPAKGWPPERARRGHRLPGKGLPWAGGALRAGAFAAFPKRKKPGARAGRVNRKEGGSGLLAARRRPL